MIIVIGGTGFIGTYLVDALLESGKEVFVTGRNKAVLNHYKKKGVAFCNLDLSDRKSFKQLPTENVEAIVLLAALLPANVQDYNPQDYVDINITGTLNILEFCRENSIKTLISTTSYADVRSLWIKDQPIPSDAHREPLLLGDHAVYVISKNAATDLILHYNQEYKLSGSIFRFPPVYGYGPHSEIYVDGKYYKSGFQIFLEKAQEGKSIEIFGDATVSRDVVYIKDVTQAFIKAIESGKAKGVYNISSGESLPLDEQVKDIIQIFSEGKQSEIEYYPEKNNSSISYIFDISKAKKDFGYKPTYIPFKELLKDYKKEMESGKFQYIVNSRKKHEE